MKITRVGVDLAKNVFQVHGVNRAGRCVWKRQLKRSNWLQVLTEKLEPGCEIGMEACGGSHQWARELRSRGFVVKLVSPQFVKPFVKSQKNDANDAEAVCEAISRPSMRYVPLRKAIPDWLEDAENGLSDNFRALLFGLWEDFQQLEQRVKDIDRQINTVSNTNPDAKRLKQLRGVGPLVSTALVAQFGDGRQFTRGRQASASIGVTPRHAGTGGKNLIYGITTRGDPYLRSILIHGARAVVSQAKRRDDALSRWVTDLADRTHTNVAAVALANKTARMAWAMLRHGTDYDPELARA